jgi:hypothetical protein
MIAIKIIINEDSGNISCFDSGILNMILLKLLEINIFFVVLFNFLFVF